MSPRAHTVSGLCSYGGSGEPIVLSVHGEPRMLFTAGSICQPAPGSAQTGRTVPGVELAKDHAEAALPTAPVVFSGISQV